MKRLLIILALALGGVLVAEEAQAYPRARFYRGYGPGVRVYGGGGFYGPRVYAARPYGYYAPRYSAYSYGYPRTYGGWWGYRPAPYYYGGPGYYGAPAYYGGYYGGPGVSVGIGW